MQQTDENNTLLLDYWRVLKRRRWAVYSALMLTLVVVGAASYLATPEYRAAVLSGADAEVLRTGLDVAPGKGPGRQRFDVALLESLQVTHHDARRGGERAQIRRRHLQAQ